MEETTGNNVTPPPFSFRKTEELKKQIGNIIVGQEKAVELILAAILTDGHLLIEGVPGTAKTLLAKLVSKLIDAQFSWVQFTPDLMPSDVLGTTVFNMQNGTFDFHRGPVFADMILVDEINRAPAKTQSALFEVMEERQVTIDGTTYPMGDIYTIIATQNPVEHEGTYRLPEAQLDRFLFKIEMEYPNLAEEAWILERHNQEDLSVKVKQTEPILTKEELLTMRREMRRVFIEPTLIRYIASLVYHSRNNKTIYLGASPRASVALLQSSKAYAILQGRDFVTPGDIQSLTVPVFRHRLILTAEAEMEGYTTEKVIRRLIEKVEVPQ